MPPPKLCSSWGNATFAIVLSKACIAVAIIKAIAACRRPEFESVMTSTVIKSYRVTRSGAQGMTWNEFFDRATEPWQSTAGRPVLALFHSMFGQVRWKTS